MVKIIFASGEELIVTSGFPVAVTKSISEIQDLSKRKGSFSKTINIQGDKETNKILGHYYAINLIEGSFDRKALTPVILTQDGVQILKGNLRLINIVKNSLVAQLDNQVSYELVVYDDTASFFQTIQGQNLNVLDFTAFNHTYSAANVVSSFTHTWVNGYKYTFPLTNDSSYDLNELRPGIYARQVWDKIFANAGYSYEWNSMDDPEFQFSKLILPYTGDVLKFEPDEFKDYYTKVENTSSQTFNATAASIAAGVQTPWTTVNPITSAYGNDYLVEAPTVITDDGNNYSSVNSRYLAPVTVTGALTYKTRVKVNLDFNLFNAGSTAIIGALATPGPVPQDFTVGWNYRVRFRVIDQNNNWKGSGILFLDKLFSVDVGGVGTPYTLPSGITNIASNLSFDFIITSPQVLDTDSLRIVIIGEPEAFVEGGGPNLVGPRWRDASTAALVPIVNQIVINSLEVEYYPDPEAISFGAQLNMNRFLPKMKQTDFIKGILNLYNLYADIDPETPNRLIIQGRNEYYDSSTVTRDWTSRLAQDLDQNIRFASEDSGRSKVLKYKEGKTAFNEFYQNTTAETYGQWTYVLDDRNLRGVDTIEIPFSPTPLVENTSTFQIVHAHEGKAPKGNVKIVYDGGLLPSQPYDIVDYYEAPGGASAVGELGLTAYPYTGHYDNPFTPTFDLNYNDPQFLGYDKRLTETGNNMFNLHWRRTFNQINDAKILEAYFWLDNVEFSNTKLNDKVFVHNEIYNIVEIRDYDADQKRPTFVKLIQIDDTVSVGGPGNSPGPLPNPGGGPLPDLPGIPPIIAPGPDIPVNDTPNPVIIGAVIRSKNVDLGVNNTVKGVYNYLGEETKNSTIIGNGNQILSSVETSVIVSDGETITEPLADAFPSDSQALGDNIILASLNSDIVEPPSIYNAVIASVNSNISGGGIGAFASIILGGNGNNITAEGPANSILGGINGLIDNCFNNSIIGGNGHFITGIAAGNEPEGSTIIGGLTNDITDAKNSSLLGGVSNVVLGGNRSVIVGGNGNTVSSNDSLILGSVNSTTGTLRTAIISGQSNLITNTSSDSVLFGGFGCTINNSFRSAIIGSFGSELQNGDRSQIIGSNALRITNSERSIILNGESSSLQDGIINSNDSALITTTAEQSAKIENSARSTVIASTYDAGTTASVFAAPRALALNTDMGRIYAGGGVFNSIISSSLSRVNYVANAKSRNLILNCNNTEFNLQSLNSSYATAISSNTCSINPTAGIPNTYNFLGHLFLSSDDSTITALSERVRIMGSRLITANDCRRLTIANSTNLTLNTVFDAVILNLTGLTFSSADNDRVHTSPLKVHGNNIVISTPFTPTGTADTAGQTGEITWDDDYVYVKTSVGWKRSTLATF